MSVVPRGARYKVSPVGLGVPRAGERAGEPALPQVRLTRKVRITDGEIPCKEGPFFVLTPALSYTMAEEMSL